METNLSDHLVVPHVPDILLVRPQVKIKDQGQNRGYIWGGNNTHI